MWLLTAVAVVIVVAAGGLGWLVWRLGQETLGPVAVTNPGGKAGKALLVYQPGLTGFPTDVAHAYGDGLVANGWEVASTAVSRQAPSDLTGYDLIVLTAPVYAGAAAGPLRRYVARVGDFRGKAVVVLLAGAGDVDKAVADASAAVKAANGRPVEAFGVTSMKPNDEANGYTGSNTERAQAIARDAARDVAAAIAG
jgi:hypothetical protein